jgi:hypothetical protein
MIMYALGIDATPNGSSVFAQQLSLGYPIRPAQLSYDGLAQPDEKEDL